MNSTATSEIDEEYQNTVISYSQNFMKYIMIVTVPLYFEVIYCLIWKSPNFQKHYVWILSIHIILCLCGEIYSFQFVRPLIFLPVIGIYADGLLSMLGIHVFIQITGIILIFQTNAAVMIHITLFRLKIILPVGYKHYDRVVHIGKVVIVMMYIFAILAIAALGFLYEDQYEAKIYIEQTLKPLPTFFWSEKYIVSTTKQDRFSLFMVVGFACIIVFGFFCTSIPLLSWYILKKSKNTLSPSVVQGHKSYLCVLLTQYQNSALVSTSVVMMLLNGSVSTFTFLIGTKPYRRVMKQQFNIVCSRAGIAKPRKYMSSTNAISDVQQCHTMKT